jgi:hypothetical protein
VKKSRQLELPHAHRKASGRATHAYRCGSYANRWTYNSRWFMALAQVQVLLDLAHEKRVKSMARNRKNDSVNGFVEDGYAHAVQRRRLRGKMEQEIARLVADRAKSISPTALF